jgi:6-phosphogluconate dehydrogenase (decarboxylating)
MKITLHFVKPRNPLVAACLQRRAGSHRPRAGALRQQIASAMRREFAACADRHKPSP